MTEVALWPYVARRPHLRARRGAAQLLRGVRFYDVTVLMSDPVAANALHRACLRLDCGSYVEALMQGCSLDAMSEAIEDLESPQ
jgi:hypothetical protein